MNFSFSGKPPATTAPTNTGFAFSGGDIGKGLTFGAPGTQAQTTGFSFGAPTAPSQSTSALNFGLGSGIGVTSSASTPAFSMGGSGTQQGFGLSAAPTPTTGFGLSTPTTQSSGFGLGTTSTPVTGSFGFGNVQQSTTSFGASPMPAPAFGTQAGAPTPQSGFGAPQPTAQTGLNMGMTPSSGFGLGSTASTAPSGFGIAAPPQTAASGFGPAVSTNTGFALPAPVSSGFNISGQIPNLSSGFGGLAASTAGTTPTFNLATPSAPVASSTGFAASSTPSLTTPATSSLSFGNAAAPTSTFTGLNFGLGAPKQAASSAFGATLSSTSTVSSLPSTTSTFSLSGLTTSTPASSTGFTTGLPASTAPSGLLFTGKAVPTAAPSIALSKPLTALSTPSTVTSAPTTGFTLGGGGLASATAATTSVTSATPTTVTTLGTATPAMGPTQSFNDLEESINKWTLELEEQEKVFMNQALQLNAWDRLLIKNSDKVLELNDVVEKVKQEQQQLDQELDFVLSQQRELEELITPLENELKNVPITDPDRQHTYQLAENMDSQLKQMCEELKEIIEHLNDSSRTEDPNDPIVQIGRILNAHMNSLQWIDRNTALIGSNLDQVSKLHETHRREHERSFHLTYE